jgi:hypothetical protein
MNAFMVSAQQIYIKAHRAGNSSGQLAKECVTGIDVNSFAILSFQQTALLRALAGIMTRQQGFEMIVPFVHEIKAALLHPAVKVGRGEGIGENEKSDFPGREYRPELLPLKLARGSIPQDKESDVRR